MGADIDDGRHRGGADPAGHVAPQAEGIVGNPAASGRRTDGTFLHRTQRPERRIHPSKRRYLYYNDVIHQTITVSINNIVILISDPINYRLYNMFSNSISNTRNKCIM